MPPEPEGVRLAAAFRIMGLLRQRWVVMESADGLVLFDPKAAHERITYEELLHQHAGTLATQGLLVPVLLVSMAEP